MKYTNINSMQVQLKSDVVASVMPSHLRTKLETLITKSRLIGITRLLQRCGVMSDDEMSARQSFAAILSNQDDSSTSSTSSISSLYELVESGRSIAQEQLINYRHLTTETKTLKARESLKAQRTKYFNSCEKISRRYDSR